MSTAAWHQRARAAVTGHLPRPADLRHDLAAGVPGAMICVPDGMASSLLVGVNPAQGLYACVTGAVVGGMSTSTRMMIVSTTTAASLASAAALVGVPMERRAAALGLITVLAGVFILIAAALRLGRYVRFVSRSVMLGFLTGAACNIFLGQLPDLTGAPAVGDLTVTRAWNVLAHPERISWPAAMVGVGALALMFGLAFTPVEKFGTLLAVAIPTALVAPFGIEAVETVADLGEMSYGLPMPQLPSLADLTPTMAVSALAVAAIVVVQGAGVAQTAPNPDGSLTRPNQDLASQGLSNLASGVLRGLPVGGSMSSTAVNVAAGARTRWASVAIGVWMLLIMLLLGPVVGLVPLPTLAAVLIYASIISLRPSDLREVWRTSTSSRVAMVGTFVAAMVLPVAAAVGVGVLISLLLQLDQDAHDLRVVRLVRDGDELVETEPPETLPDREPVVLDVYGSLLYAGSQTLEARLPVVGEADRPVVVLRLRGRTSLGATFFAVVAGYAEALAERGGVLYLSGVGPSVMDRFQRTQGADVRGQVHLFEAHPTIGESTSAALDAAEQWLVDVPARGAD